MRSLSKKTNFQVNGISYYRATATVGKDGDGKLIRKQFYGSSKKEAEAKRDEYLMNINKGLSHNFDKALFSSVFEVWFETVLRPSLALSSYKRYETDYRLRIKNSALSSRKLMDIKSINIQSYYNELAETYSVNTVRNTHKLLSNFFSYCVKSDLIIKNPLAVVEVPKDKKIKDRERVISKDDRWCTKK